LSKVFSWSFVPKAAYFRAALWNYHLIIWHIIKFKCWTKQLISCTRTTTLLSISQRHVLDSISPQLIFNWHLDKISNWEAKTPFLSNNSRSREILTSNSRLNSLIWTYLKRTNICKKKETIESEDHGLRRSIVAKPKTATKNIHLIWP
jgi:hypothetical protein